MNRTIISGRLGRDPELKTGQTGAEYCQFSVAVDRRKSAGDEERQTDWFRCVAFGKTAAFIDKYFKKGDGIEIQGRMENSPYKDKDTDKTRDSWQLIVEVVEFPKGKSGAAQETAPAAAPVDGFSIADEDIPF